MVAQQQVMLAMQQQATAERKLDARRSRAEEQRAQIVAARQVAKERRLAQRASGASIATLASSGSADRTRSN
jgi:hypothetical protein